jgi:MFS family permease
MRPFDSDLEALDRKMHMPSHLEPTTGKEPFGRSQSGVDRKHPGQTGFSAPASHPPGTGSTRQTDGRDVKAFFPSSPSESPASGLNSEQIPEVSSPSELSEAMNSASTPDRISDLSTPASEIAEDEPGLLPVLKNRNFLTLWSGQVFSQLADKVYLVLMIAIIASRFQSADQTISGWVSSLMIAFTIPAILFGSVAGVFVDHWRKRAVLVSTNLLRGGLVLALPFLLWVSHSWGSMAGMPFGFLVLLVVTFLVSTLTQFFAPAEQAAIPLIVERRHLLSANSLYTMTMMASVIIGFALGEPLLALADAVIAPLAPKLHLASDMGKEILVGGSYAIAGLLLMLLRTHEKTVDAHEDLPDVWKNIRDGLRYLQHQGLVRAALIQLVILFSIFAALAVLAVRLAEIMPELKSSQFGFLLAAGGVGMAIGAVVVGQFGQRFSRAQLSLYGSVGMGVSLAAISFFAQHLLPTLPWLVLLGACSAIAGVPMQTAIQEETPEEMRGKVFGLQNNAINIALSLPLALAGIAETWFGLQAVFLTLAGMAIAGGILTWSISRKQTHQKTT